MIYLAQQHVSNNMTISIATIYVALSYPTLKQQGIVSLREVVAWKEQRSEKEEYGAISTWNVCDG